MTRWDVFVWILAPAAVLLATLATTTCVLKRRRGWATIGAIATATAAVVMVSSWSASSEGFEDLALGIAYAFVVAPLVLLTVIGSFQRARSGSWWLRRHAEAAPPPKSALSQ